MCFAYVVAAELVPWLSVSLETGNEVLFNSKYFCFAGNCASHSLENGEKTSFVGSVIATKVCQGVPVMSQVRTTQNKKPFIQKGKV